MRYRLITELHDRKIRIDWFAKQLRLSCRTLERKLLGTRPFTLPEIERILRLFPERTFHELFPKEEEES
jgi:hypothetical protein